MSARDEILARVRAALAPEPAPATAIPREYRTTQDGLDPFLDASRTTTPARSRRPRRARRHRAATLKHRDARNMITPDGVPGGWLTTVNPIKDTPPLDNDALDGADGVVTTCALAIAQTGTIVLDGGPGMGRRALTLLPDYHLCVVRTEQIVPLGPRGPRAPGPDPPADVHLRARPPPSTSRWSASRASTDPGRST